jgi:hypothetical protein
MIKLSAKTLDVYDDADMSVARHLAPSLGDVKVAERDVIEALEDQQFGLVMKTAGGFIRRRYPLHDADAVKLSRAYFDLARSGLPEAITVQVEAKLAAAEQTFKLREAGLSDADAATILSKVAYVDAEQLRPARKKASYDKPVWGIVIDGKTMFPLHDATMVKAAAERFKFTASELQPIERFEYARAIAKQAEVHGVTLDPHSAIHNYTANEVNVEALKLALHERKRIMKAAEMNTEILDQLYLAAGCLPDRTEMEKDASWQFRLTRLAAIPRLPADQVVATLQGIDKFAGLGRVHYNRGLPDPFAACFKQAAAESATAIDGVDLSKIQPHRLAAAFSPDFVQEFSANPIQVYTSLPDPVKVMVRTLAEEGATADAGNATPAPASPVGDPTALLNPTLTNAAGTSA